MTADGAGGRRAARKALTREELLDAGRALFSDRGLYESRIEDLTARAGVAKGTLYQYFNDKDELVHAVVARGFEELEAALDRRPPPRALAGAAVAGLVAGYLAFYRDRPDLLRIFHQVRGLLKFTTGPHRRLRGLLESHVDRSAGRLAAHRDGSRLSPARRRRLARLVFGHAAGTASVAVSLGVAVAPPGDIRVPVTLALGLIEASERSA
jgi:AcrR family transcriptional regulator